MTPRSASHDTLWRAGPKPGVKTPLRQNLSSDVFATVPGIAITFGYARVSTAAQVLDALRAAGVDDRHVRVETASGRRPDRPVLAGLLSELGEGDTLVVAKLDRLGRSMPHLVGLVGELERRGVSLRFLSEQIDTASPAGKFMVHKLAALAQMEAGLIRERTNEGLGAARARGRVGGRPTVMNTDRIASARALLAGGQSVTAVAGVLGVSVSTVRRHAVAVDSVLKSGTD